MRILMVCLGNICRSPMADGLLRKKVKKLDLSVEVDSAGTAAYHVGNAPDKRMRALAKEMNCSIDDLRARQFKKEDYDRFDLIYAMDRSNYQNIIELANSADQEKKVRMILDELPDEELNEVPDPYFGGEDGFVQVYDLLDRATDAIIEKHIR